MTQEQDQYKAETVSLLQELGLKEYEARCFIALSQVSVGTAKEISELSEVPRTRVYDAVRVLEAQGLVEVQHSNPQRFRAVSVEEAAVTLRQKYDNRIDTLQSHLESIELPDDSDEDDKVQEVWSLSSHEAIQSRTFDLLRESESEIVFVVVEEAILTDALFDKLREASERGVNLILGGINDDIVSRIETELSSAKVFETELEWLVEEGFKDEVAISRLLLTDRTNLLVSSFYPKGGLKESKSNEQAVFATGLGNGVVVLIRRLISTGLGPIADPAQ